MKKRLLLPTIFTYLLLSVLLVRFVLNGNYEFIGYEVVVGLLYYFVLLADKKYNFPVPSIWFFAIWIASHMLGGAIYIGKTAVNEGTRLYDIVLIKLYDGSAISPEFIILKYDQLIHLYCYFAIGILVYYMLKSHFKKNQKIALTVFAILAAIGIGLLNEVIEFGMVIFADAAKEVGGYYNTALDLVFNLIGAALGATFAKDILDKAE